MAGLFLLLAAGPLLALGNALFRAAALFWPTMIVLGAVHHDVNAFVPALGWWASFLVVLLISLLVPTASTSDSD